MLKKNCVFCVLMLGIMLFMGCGGTIAPLSVMQSQPAAPGPQPFWKSCLPSCLFPPPQQQQQIPFSPVGSWEMVSMDGKAVAEYFALFGGNLADIETRIVQNDFVFIDNGSWFWTLALDMKADLGGAVALIPKMSLASAGSYTGSYTPSGGRMIIIQQDMQIKFEPEDFWASVGVSEADFKQAITRDWLFGKVENWEGHFVGNQTHPDRCQRNHAGFKMQISCSDALILARLPQMLLGNGMCALADAVIKRNYNV